MSRKPAITATGLKKAYDDKTVLDGIDISVDRGTVFALLGPNGAGKTTIVEILSTLVPADGGDIRIAGYNPSDDPDAVRSRIGVTGQFSAVDDYLSGEENLLLMADLHHLGKDERRTRTEELLKKFDLIDSADKLASTYSGGMRRRLDLAMTLIGRPEIIFLDEPTTGLDPRSRRTMCRSSGSWSRAVSPSSSRPSTSRKLINWPTTSPSSIRDGSSPKVRQRNSNGTSPAATFVFTSSTEISSILLQLFSTNHHVTMPPMSSRSPATGVSARCALFSTNSTLTRSTSRNSPCTHPTWTTCS